MHTKFKGDNIENLNLNNVYEFFSQENQAVFDNKEKKLNLKYRVLDLIIMQELKI